MMPHFIKNHGSVAVNRNRIHSIIKNFREAFPENFAKCGLEVCDKCEGTGLPITPAKSCSITPWTDEYCGKCKGFGVLNIKQIYGEYLCRFCKGDGCNTCKFTGAVDWISNVVKKGEK